MIELDSNPNYKVILEFIPTIVIVSTVSSIIELLDLQMSNSSREEGCWDTLFGDMIKIEYICEMQIKLLH